MLKVEIKSISRTKMKEARPASPPVVLVEAAPTFRISRYSVIFFWTEGKFCKDSSL
jgi:hypothetical protein